MVAVFTRTATRSFSQWAGAFALLVACDGPTTTPREAPPREAPRQWKADALLSSGKAAFATEDSSISHFQVHGVGRDGTMRADGKISFTKIESSRCLQLDWAVSAPEWSSSATQLGLCLPNLYGTVPAARCRITEIWERAIARNADPSAFAHVAFMPNARDGAWTFWIGDYREGLKFDDDCVPVVEAQP